ncbi:hypothetical protein LAUMK41_00602 [Mycobacterium attenuatum]|nr:hypothetical protein LAUMK41_00602 [Mycobacterium attenuatum]
MTMLDIVTNLSLIYRTPMVSSEELARSPHQLIMNEGSPFS